jgi:sec-independent protein translocase protein TatA
MFAIFGVGTGELIVILIILLLLFGASRLPAAMRGLGKGVREFKKGLSEDDTGTEITTQLKAAVGKQARLLQDGTLEVGVNEGVTVLEVDESGLLIQAQDGTKRIPVGNVRRIVHLK